MTTDTTFVLVHAAWADSSSWAPLSDQRQQRGHNAIAAPLPLTSFDDDRRSRLRRRGHRSGKY